MVARRARKVLEMSIARGWDGALGGAAGVGCCWFAKRMIDEGGQRSELETKQVLYSASKVKGTQGGYICIVNERLSRVGNCFLPQDCRVGISAPFETGLE